MPVAVANRPLTLEQLFRAEPYRGESAKDIKFSANGRYLAYLWNPFGEPGSDLYVHDTQTGKTIRVSSPATIARPSTIRFGQSSALACSRITVEIAPGPASMGTASGVISRQNSTR